MCIPLIGSVVYIPDTTHISSHIWKRICHLSYIYGLQSEGIIYIPFFHNPCFFFAIYNLWGPQQHQVASENVPRLAGTSLGWQLHWDGIRGHWLCLCLWLAAWPICSVHPEPIFVYMYMIACVHVLQIYIYIDIDIDILCIYI